MVRTALMTVGVVGAVGVGVSAAAFGGAVRETFRMTSVSLKRVYDDVVEEGVPETFNEILGKLD